MSNIEEMAKLQAKSKVYSIEISDGVKANLEIHPLGLDDMSLLSGKQDMNMKEMAENSKALIAASLKIEEKDVVMSLRFMEQIMNAIMDLNGFDKNDMKGSAIKNFLDEQKKKGDSNVESTE